MKNLILIHTLFCFFGMTHFGETHPASPLHEDDSAEITVCDSIELSLNVSPSTPILSCDFPCVTLVAMGTSSNGDFLVEWEIAPGQSSVSVCEAGTYTAIITDLTTTCTYSKAVTVNNIELPTINAGPNQEVSCVNTCTQLQAQLPNIQDDFTIEWNGPDGFVSNLLTPNVCTPGTYVLHIHESGSGCTITDSVEVMEVYEAIHNSLQIQVCPGDCFIFDGVSYCETGNHQAIFTSAQLCDSIVELQLTEIPVHAEIDLPGLITCAVPQLPLNTSNSTLYQEAYYQWTTPDGQFTSEVDDPTSIVDQSGTYIFSISWNGCTVADTVMVSANQVDPDANAGEDVEINCIDLQATLNASMTADTSGKSFSWAGPENFFASDFEVVVEKAGAYELTVQDNANGCVQSDEVIVKEFIPYQPTLTVEPSCFNDTSGSIEITNDSLGPSYQFSVSDNAFQGASKFESLQAGEYNLVWLDDYGCGDTLDVEVPELSAIELRMEDSYSICGDNYITLNAAVNINETPGPVTYLWNDGATIPAMRTNRIGNFWVEITSACEVYRHEFEVSNDLVTVDKNIYVPNAFSPNSDMTNDRFRAYINHDIIFYQLQVYDRRGGLMFSTEEPSEGWDGTIKGVQAAPGVYSWWLRIKIATCGGGRSEGYHTGDVTLFR